MTAAPPPKKLVAQQLTLFSKEEGKAGVVQLSHELVGLLSEQLYQSPLKAIEELVVNAYDADADECRMYVPSPTELGTAEAFVAIFDDGIGMDRQGLLDLWHIGHSRKRDADMVARLKRKSIGRFGIGKLATYSVGKRLTYLSKHDGGKVLGVTVDFSSFESSERGSSVKVPLPIHRLERWSEFQEDQLFKRVIGELGLEPKKLAAKSWTLAIIEDLKPKAAEMKAGRLNWVLSTAMPVATGFKLFLNKVEVTSSKERSTKLVEFEVKDLPPKRLANLEESTHETWKVEGEKVVSKEFPSGITGRVFVSERSLYGKSDDIARSHGFFVKVRGRLINLSDPYFGVFPKSYEVWNSFHAEVNVDDLDDLIMSSREGVEVSTRKNHLEALLHELFNEARVRFQAEREKRELAQKPKREEEREFVGPRLLEEPLADALLQQRDDAKWFYLSIPGAVDTAALVDKLYNLPRSTYSYSYERHGKNAYLFKYDPNDAKFTINDDHEFVKEHSEDPRARHLLEDVVTAEMMLEVYLRRSGVRADVVEDVLTSRDTLLKSLSRDRRFSLQAIAASLRDAVADENDLEVALIYSARALGFVAQHIAGAGEPDGLAKFVDYPGGERRLILEAKASINVPSLSAIDFAGLHSHMINKNYNAEGCLLLAPAYPGNSKEDSEAALRAKNLKISCWTVEQLARVVEHAEARHITARAILDVVTTTFAPKDVEARIAQLLQAPAWKHQDLYQGILKALRDLEDTGTDAPRNVSMVLALLGTRPEFRGIKKEEVETAIAQVAAASKGGITFRSAGENIIIHASWDEIERRLAPQIGALAAPRKQGLLRKKH